MDELPLTPALMPPVKVAKAQKVNPADIDTMLSLIPPHAAEAMFPSCTPEQREQILEVIAEYCLNINGKRRAQVWATLASTISEQFQGLAVDPVRVRSFCNRHVLPNIVVARSYVMRAILERGLSVDTLASTLEMRAKMEEDYDKARKSLNEREVDAAGRLVLTGTRPDELASLGKGVLQANKIAGDELERWGFVPESKKAPTLSLNLGVNLAGGMSKLAGRYSDSIDVTPKPNP